MTADYLQWESQTTAADGSKVTAVNWVHPDKQQAWIDAARAALVRIPSPPMSLFPRTATATTLDVVWLPDGTGLTVDASGNLYRDGRRFGSFKVSRVTTFGASIYADGATDGKWWRWNGVGWVESVDNDVGVLPP
jgi:hypothetical protein